MKNYSIEEIIKGIKHRNDNIFRYLYKEIYPSIKKYIINSNGSEDDAKDIFQESLILLYKMSCKQGFMISSSIKTYIFSIAKNLWYQKIKNKKVYSNDLAQVEDEEATYNPEGENLFDEPELDERLRVSLLQKYFRKLDHFCQKILQLFYKGDSHEEISKKLKINVDLSKSRKKMCLQKLMELISADPEYQKYYGA